MITINVEVLIASLRTATNPPSGHGPSPFSANVTFLETSVYDSDNRMAETSLDFGLALAADLRCTARRSGRHYWLFLASFADC